VPKKLAQHFLQSSGQLSRVCVLGFLRSEVSGGWPPVKNLPQCIDDGAIYGPRQTAQGRPPAL
jgi:hypothetical protein